MIARPNRGPYDDVIEQQLRRQYSRREIPRHAFQEDELAQRGLIGKSLDSISPQGMRDASQMWMELRTRMPHESGTLKTPINPRGPQDDMTESELQRIFRHLQQKSGEYEDNYSDPTQRRRLQGV